MSRPKRKSKYTFEEAKGRYWKNLVGLALYPMAFFFASEFTLLPFWLLLIGMFVVAGIAASPVLSRNAPYNFWLLAIGVWMAGGMVAVVLVALVRVILSWNGSN